MSEQTSRSLLLKLPLKTLEETTPESQNQGPTGSAQGGGGASGRTFTPPGTGETHSSLS